MVLEMIKRRPRVESPAAVMVHEIGLGLGPSLVAEVRGQGAPPDSADRRPASVQYASLCPRCSRLRHDPQPCPDAEPRVTRQRAVESPPLLAVVQPDEGSCCQYEPCPGRSAPVAGDGYHDTCRYLAGVKALGPSPPSRLRERTEAS